MSRSDYLISGIVLAAGKSVRMGRVKQLLPFGGKTILGRIVESALGSLLCEVVVVLGYAAEEIRQVVDFGDARVIVNPGYEQGQSTSLQAGLAAVSAQSNAAIFILGDQPLVNEDVINTLIEGYRLHKAPLVIPTFHGRRGNPVIIDRSLFPRIESLTGDVGARVLFEEYADQIEEIEMGNDRIHFDVDTWDDYIKLREMEGDASSNRLRQADSGN